MRMRHYVKFAQCMYKYILPILILKGAFLKLTTGS